MRADCPIIAANSRIVAGLGLTGGTGSEGQTPPRLHSATPANAPLPTRRPQPPPSRPCRGASQYDRSGQHARRPDQDPRCWGARGIQEALQGDGNSRSRGEYAGLSSSCGIVTTARRPIDWRRSPDRQHLLWSPPCAYPATASQQAPPLPPPSAGRPAPSVRSALGPATPARPPSQPASCPPAEGNFRGLLFHGRRSLAMESMRDLPERASALESRWVSQPFRPRARVLQLLGDATSPTERST